MPNVNDRLILLKLSKKISDDLNSSQTNTRIKHNIALDYHVQDSNTSIGYHYLNSDKKILDASIDFNN